MGCVRFKSNSNDSQYLRRKAEKTSIVVATLNYCGINNSPFEYYCETLEAQQAKISDIFVQLIPKYFPRFNKQGQFQWKMGEIDKRFRIGRYCPLFGIEIGIEDNAFVTRQKFVQKWHQRFNKAKADKVLEFKYTDQEKQQTLNYDLTCFHTLLKYALRELKEIKEITDAQQLTVTKYRQCYIKFFDLSFLDQSSKTQQIATSMSKIQADVFFFQKPSEQFVNYIQKYRKDFYSNHDGKKDSLIVARKSTFDNQIKMDLQLKKYLNQHLNWSGQSAFLLLHPYLLIGVHITSKPEQNQKQCKKLRQKLPEFHKKYPDLEIIVAGDVNSYIQPFDDQFSFYPNKEQDHTTIKKRTMIQGQYKKGNKQIRESKDIIISTLKLNNGQLKTLADKKQNQDQHQLDIKFMPSDEHPCDHFIVCATLDLKKTKKIEFSALNASLNIQN